MKAAAHASVWDFGAMSSFPEKPILFRYKAVDRIFIFAAKSSDLGKLAGNSSVFHFVTKPWDQPLHDEGEAYARKLMDAGAPVAATRYNKMIHDFVLLNASVLPFTGPQSGRLQSMHLKHFLRA